MASTTVEQIERAIENLSAHEVEELYAWLDEHYPQPIDRRLASDLAAGRLDSAIDRALDDEQEGRTRQL